VAVINASINDSNSYSFASDAGLVKLIDSGHIMEGIVCCEGFLCIGWQRLRRRKHNLVGGPCLTDGGFRLKSINILVRRFDSRTRKYLAVE
jgi:hypothetical protein